MPYGLQIYGPSGDLWVDTSTSLGRQYGSITLGPGDDSENLSGLTGQGTPFAIIPDPEIQSDTYSGFDTRCPTVSSLTFSGTTLNADFAFANYTNPYVFCYYGAF